LDNPDASREKFIPNPFSELNCKTLYKTGDLAYYSEEGLIYFIGRIDAQIKLNGNRIEPGEIETILMQQIGIAQAVVTLERDQNQDFILVAYLVFLPSLTPNLQAIKTRLFDLLPIHMVPTLFFQVDSIPELSNGKIDRKSLQHKTKMIMKKPENSLEVPSQFEQKMIEIWRDILGNEVIDANDHFFVDLHCDSLKLILFILSLDKQMKIPLSTQEIYAAPTTKLLAQYILSQHLTLNKSFSV
jgi:acyl carrier protein